MPPLIVCQELSKGFGSTPLFQRLSFTVNEGERLGLIGPNGSGKSTLLRILAGSDEADSGVCSRRKGLRLSYVPQQSAFPTGRSVREWMFDRAAEGEDRDVRVANLLSQAGFEDHAADPARLSGGWKKRLAIVCGLAANPDVLLLDEPTNHLDLEGIEWLEDLLSGAAFASVVISHDRYFLENVATQMAELNRVYADGIFKVEGNYGRFLERRSEYLAAQEKLQESLEIQVRKEIAWLRRGAKARTTKSKARIDAAGRLIEELAEVTARGRKGAAAIDFTASERRTKKLIEVKGLGKSAGGRVLFRDLQFRLSPGMRMGLVGANGTGKTTLLRLLTGELPPDEGVIERAENLRVVYFDQNREAVNGNVTLRRALAPDGDSVIFRDRVVHVAGWAKRFLFRADQLEQPVSRLSGGETARLLIARLMLEPADVLLLDEPTNDLDIPTLEVLEENLSDFPGALVLVTHDRFLLDSVSTTVLGLDGEGGALLYADYHQWEDEMERRWAEAKKVERVSAAPTAPAPVGKKKLGYLEARELEGIEERILEAERELEEKRALLHDPAVVVDGVRLGQVYEEMLTAQKNVDALYARWSELEEKAG